MTFSIVQISVASIEELYIRYIPSSLPTHKALSCTHIPLMSELESPTVPLFMPVGAVQVALPSVCGSAE